MSFYNVSSIHSTLDKLQKKKGKNQVFSQPFIGRLLSSTLVFLIPLSSSFSLASEERRQPASLWSTGQTWLLHFDGLQLTSTRQNGAQHGSILAQSAHKALIQTNTSYFLRVSRGAGSQRSNRMFLTRFIMYQRRGLGPKCWHTNYSLRVYSFCTFIIV